MSCSLCSEEAPLSEHQHANMDVNTAPSVHIFLFLFLNVQLIGGQNDPTKFPWIHLNPLSIFSL